MSNDKDIDTWDSLHPEYKPFWEWVVAKRVTDTPTGDFVEDTRRLKRVNKNPDIRLGTACQEAADIHRRLLRQWLRKNGITLSTNKWLASL